MCENEESSSIEEIFISVIIGFLNVQKGHFIRLKNFPRIIFLVEQKDSYTCTSQSRRSLSVRYLPRRKDGPGVLSLARPSLFGT